MVVGFAEAAISLSRRMLVANSTKVHGSGSGNGLSGSVVYSYEHETVSAPDIC
jgi:hypothetical protein